MYFFFFNCEPIFKILQHFHMADPLMKQPLNSKTVFTTSFFWNTDPSGPNAGAGNVNQSASSQKSLDQSADQTETRLSAEVANQSRGAEIPISCS